MDKDGYLTLTDAGLDVAHKIYERHTVLSNLLIRLGVSKKSRSRTHASSSTT